ncbi:hypothetical protein BC834DRAFT_871643 [Gloeopeniophorella convolvens]|nr:hypothetical protein BC834DRAFT_910870 [Gloeopeniophorella convolvens]KAI0267510.1 hypothetical protein BC834DRAFT_871643 [Gloeopeniophorella convolvens]
MASLHFCSECNNLLYPKAEQQRRTMVYACRICPNVDETVDNGLVYRNDLLNVTREQPGVTTDLPQDTTLAHATLPCPQCGNEDSVKYQDQSKRKETRMILFYVCTRCNHSYEENLEPNQQKYKDDKDDRARRKADGDIATASRLRKKARRRRRRLGLPTEPDTPEASDAERF